MLNIFICDDDRDSADKLADMVSEYCNNRNIQHRLDVFYSGSELLAADTDRCDLLLCDVDMGSENGISIAARIRKTNRNMVLVYVSGYVQYAPAGYNVKAFAYILKNDLDSLFETTMDSVMKQLNFMGAVFSFRYNDEEISLPLQDIYYIESFDKTADIHTAEKTYSLRSSIGEIARKLADKGFVQIHKSYVVNMQHISKLKNYHINLSNGTVLTASQRRWKDIMARYLKWKGDM